MKEANPGLVFRALRASSSRPCQVCAGDDATEHPCASRQPHAVPSQEPKPALPGPALARRYLAHSLISLPPRSLPARSQSRCGQRVGVYVRLVFAGQFCERALYSEARPHRALSIILLRHGIAEQHHQPVAKPLGDPAAHFHDREPRRRRYRRRLDHAIPRRRVSPRCPSSPPSRRTSP
jgi:hypothetical protein